MAGILLVSCGKEDDGPSAVNFDRKAMLTHWADNIILPAVQNQTLQFTELATAAQSFSANPTEAELQLLKTEFRKSYLAFERAKIFEFGPAADVSFRASANTFPVDTAQVKSNISSGSYNLSAASNIDARGFPALDYLLYKKGDELVQNSSYRTYLIVVVENLQDLAEGIETAWDSYRQEFINASGTDIGSSLGMMVNAINKDYELVKNAKIGFPAGKKTLGQPYPHTAEAYFSGISLELAIANVEAIHNLYLGRSFDGNSFGPSLDAYLREVQVETADQPLDEAIDDQFRESLDALMAVPAPFSEAVVHHQTEVDKAYLAIQKNVVLLKTDMPSALGVLITYQDNDGD